MTVSVLIPTYRRPTMLARAIRSVQAQTWRDLTIEVHDNASGDGTAATVAQLARTDQRIVYHRHERNIGAAANFRHAIANVTTPLFCLLSDDDVLLPHCLEQAVAGLRVHPATMAWSGIVISASEAKATFLRPWPPWPSGSTPPALACLRVALDSRPETTGMVFRREVISPRFLGDLPGFIAADVGWVLEAAKLGGIGHTAEPSAVFFQHDGSLSTGAGTSYRRAIDVFWPSAHHLQTQFEDGCTLPAEIVAACGSAIRLTYGVRNIRRSAALALRNSDDLTLGICRDILSRLGDTSGLAFLAKLQRMPMSQARLVLRLGHGLSRLRHLALAMQQRCRLAHLTPIAHRYLRAYA